MASRRKSLSGSRKSRKPRSGLKSKSIIDKILKSVSKSRRSRKAASRKSRKAGKAASRKSRKAASRRSRKVSRALDKIIKSISKSRKKYSRRSRRSKSKLAGAGSPFMPVLDNSLFDMPSFSSFSAASQMHDAKPPKKKMGMMSHH